MAALTVDILVSLTSGSAGKMKGDITNYGKDRERICLDLMERLHW